MSSRQSILAPQFDDLHQQHEAGTLGMWVFLATEVMVFGALFTGYCIYRVKYPAEFDQGSRHLNIVYATVNTVVLLTSSLTMALAVHSAQVGRRKQLVLCLALTAFLGIGFLAIKAAEYREDYIEKLVPGVAFEPNHWTELGVQPREVKLFLMSYYIMTGLHAIHLIIGIAIILIVMILALRGHYSHAYYMPVEVSGLYWHFVDLIWIFLLPLLYLIGTRHF